MKLLDKASRIVRNKLFTLGRIRRYEQGATILKKGETIRAALFLLSGEVSPATNSSPIFLIDFLEGERAADDLKTQLPCEVLLVPREKFLEVMRNNAELACLIIDELLNETRENLSIKL